MKSTKTLGKLKTRIQKIESATAKRRAHLVARWRKAQARKKEPFARRISKLETKMAELRHARARALDAVDAPFKKAIEKLEGAAERKLAPLRRRREKLAK